jgi:hypothetical protein
MLRKPARVNREDAPPALVLTAGGATAIASPPDKQKAERSSTAGLVVGSDRMRGRLDVRVVEKRLLFPHGEVRLRRQVQSKGAQSGLVWGPCAPFVPALHFPSRTLE